MTNVIFVGPTADESSLEQIHASGFEVLPPIRRGDLKAMSTVKPGILAIVDGRFHQCLSVGHAEIRGALEQGWEIWGIASMGAIRAREMNQLGVRGYGRVYEHFLSNDDFQDDEVSLLHSPDPPYVAVSEPLIHLRYFVRHLQEETVLSVDDARKVVDALKVLWFGERSIARMLEMIASIAGLNARARADALSSDWRPFCVKRNDLSAFISRQPWRYDSYRPVPMTAPYMPGHV